jgi:hypothetical protein
VTFYKLFVVCSLQDCFSAKKAVLKRFRPGEGGACAMDKMFFQRTSWKSGHRVYLEIMSNGNPRILIRVDHVPTILLAHLRDTDSFFQPKLPGISLLRWLQKYQIDGLSWSGGGAGSGDAGSGGPGGMVVVR